jgi:hypothetical protein
MLALARLIPGERIAPPESGRRGEAHSRIGHCNAGCDVSFQPNANRRADPDKAISEAQDG